MNAIIEHIDAVIEEIESAQSLGGEHDVVRLEAARAMLVAMRRLLNGELDGLPEDN